MLKPPGSPPGTLAKTCQPPSGGCVLKLPQFALGFNMLSQPPSGGCVLKLLIISDNPKYRDASRLQAAVC